MEKLQEFIRQIALQWFAEDGTGITSVATSGGDPPTASLDDPLDDPVGDPVGDPEVDILEIDGLSLDEMKVLLKDTLGKKKKLANIARERLHEIMDKKQKMKDRELLDETARLKALEEKEAFKSLYEEIKPKYEQLNTDVSKTLEYFTTELERMKAELPEEYQSLIPENDVRSQIKWIKNFKKTVIDSKNIKPPFKKDVGSTAPATQIDANQDPAKASIKEQMLNTKSAKELEALLKSFRG